MKLRISLLTLAISSAPMMAQAATVKFTGEIVGSTCTVDAGSENLAVSMGKVDVGSLANDGDQAAHTPMPMTMTCTTAGEQVAVKFGSLTNADPVTGNLKLTGATPAANVQLGIYNASGEQQKINNNPTAGSWVATADGTIRLDYVAVYKAVGGAATAGQANTDAVFTVVYQ